MKDYYNVNTPQHQRITEINFMWSITGHIERNLMDLFSFHCACKELYILISFVNELLHIHNNECS
jgi:hypothetical protein